MRFLIRFNLKIQQRTQSHETTTQRTTATIARITAATKLQAKRRATRLRDVAHAKRRPSRKRKFCTTSRRHRQQQTHDRKNTNDTTHATNDTRAFATHTTERQNETKRAKLTVVVFSCGVNRKSGAHRASERHDSHNRVRRWIAQPEFDC